MNPEEKLSPRRVPSDGNAFFVYMSMSILDRHDQHAQIRERVWNAFCIKVFGCVLRDALDAQQQQRTVVSRECLMEWIASLAVLSETQLTAVVIKLVRSNVCEGTSSPLCIVIPLVVECYGVGVVMYDTAATIKRKKKKWEPSRVWHPPKETTRYIHLLRRDGDDNNLELLVRSSGEGIVPNRVVGSLSLRVRTNPKIEPWESPVIRNTAVYRLEVYDANTRTHWVAGFFVSPEASTTRKTVHYLPIDARAGLKRLLFSIGGCTTTNKPIYVFALTTKGGVRSAYLICHWDVDYCAPRIALEDSDDAIVVVPLADRLDASRVLVLECHCKIMDSRPIEGKI
jgi:hypothetical protein